MKQRGLSALSCSVIALGLLLTGSPSLAGSPVTAILNLLKPQPSRPTHPSGQNSLELIAENTKGHAGYISSNEFDNQVQFTLLNKSVQGTITKPQVVVSVGTFRAFNLAATLRRDYLICFDFAPGVSEFNLTLSKVIHKYSRLQFLQILLNLDSIPFLKKSAERAYFHEQITNFIQTKAILQTALDDPDLKWLLSTLNDPAYQRRFYSALLESSRTEERWLANFWGSAKSYRHLQDMINEGRLLTLTGSLSGRKSLASLAKTLKQRQMVISELDISNALESIVNSESAQGILAFQSNLRLLPFDQDSRVLLTINSHGVYFKNEKPLGHWFYKVLTPEQLEEALPQTTTARQLAQTVFELPTTPVLLHDKPRSCRDLY
jgi:hypothetical protein